MDLPIDILAEVFRKVPLPDLNAVSRVNRTWKRVFHDELRVRLTRGLEAQNGNLILNVGGHPYRNFDSIRSSISTYSQLSPGKSFTLVDKDWPFSPAEIAYPRAICSAHLIFPDVLGNEESQTSFKFHCIYASTYWPREPQILGTQFVQKGDSLQPSLRHLELRVVTSIPGTFVLEFPSYWAGTYWANHAKPQALVLHHPLVDFEMTVIGSVHSGGHEKLDLDALDIETTFVWYIERISLEKRSDRHSADTDESLIENIPETGN